MVERGEEDSWTVIEGAAQASRTPTDDDIGMYLRATVTYTDTHGDQTVSGVTDNRVEGRTRANASPSFGDHDDSDADTAGIQIALDVDENDEGAVGDPILATDDDDVVLLYSLEDTPDLKDINNKASSALQGFGPDIG